MSSIAVNRPVTIRTLGQELRSQFGCRVHKVPIHGGFTCPNRDGTLGSGGCTYCGPTGSAAAWTDPAEDVVVQLREGVAHARRRFNALKFVAYFQAFSNTYGPMKRLQQLWRAAMTVENVVGLSIGTRPDCLPDEVLDVIAACQQRVPYLCLEIGLQSAHDKTLKAIRRGHDFACFAETVSRAQSRGIDMCVHLILGLPGESAEDMLETVRAVRDLGIQGIKLHHLHILKGSPLQQEYLKGNIPLLGMEEYVSLMARALSAISDRMIVHRFMGKPLVISWWHHCGPCVKERC